MQVMLEHQQEHKLKGCVEMGDAYIGGEREGKVGRGVIHKKPFIATVETDEQANPRKIHLRAVKGFRPNAIAAYARRVWLQEVWSSVMALLVSEELKKQVIGILL